jgi:hypothetical protein
MQEGNPVGKEQIIIIEEQIKEALNEVELLIEKKSIAKDASGLEAMEREIIKVTDRLAGLIVAQKVQQSIDSAELKEEGSKLVKSLPKKMKNQGPREVEIQPSRGGPVKVVANYFSQKSKKK